MAVSARIRGKTWLGLIGSEARTYQKALRLIVTTAPTESLLMGALLVVQGLLPPLSVWLVKVIVDDVVARSPFTRLLLLVAFWAIAALLAQLASQWAMLIQANLNERVTARVELLLMRQANRLPDLFAFGWTALNARNSRLGVSDVVLLLQGIVALGEKLGAIAQMTSVLAGHLQFFAKLFGFLARESAMAVARPGRPVPRPLSVGIAFDDVSYRYPNGTLALDSVSFAIRPGERVALVGENGAGKSTLVKLLYRLYDPGQGQIQVDGADLRALDLEGWRANLGTVFQDFGRYQLTVEENVTLGRLGSVDSQDALGREASLDKQDALDWAMRRSGFDRHLPSLPNGLATPLGVEFGGVDL